MKYSFSKCKQALSVCNDTWKLNVLSQNEAALVFQKAALYCSPEHTGLKICRLARMQHGVFGYCWSQCCYLHSCFSLNRNPKPDSFSNEKKLMVKLVFPQGKFLNKGQYLQVLFPRCLLASTVTLHQPLLCFAVTPFGSMSCLCIFCFIAPAICISISSS